MTQQTSPSEIARIFDAELREPAEQEALGPRYNVAPTQPLRVVLQRDDGRFVELHRWGLVPSWSKGPGQVGARLINARAETVARNPSFRASLLGRRCIVPADGFYEWRREGRARQPFLIRPRDGRPLSFAGLWAPWRDPVSGEWLLSSTVITTAANETVGRLHDRMPVILPPATWRAWLDPQLRDGDALEHLLNKPQARPLELVAVSPLVNSPHNEGPALIEPQQPPATVALFDQ
jgi:putative SOS response-associated peptidase YedK